MNCPYCGYYDSKVIDSRDVNDGIRRRRQCLRCESRFTTYERPHPASLFVAKKDGRREEFDRDKLLAGVRKACEKRPCSGAAVGKLVDEIEAELFQMGRTEVSSGIIGDKVMARLKGLDHIAYIRFASVYRDFADITSLKEEVDTLASHPVLRSADQLPLIPPEELAVTLKSPRRLRR
ncbi:MAG: transcriptional regulator NrdR [Chloroflexi bacterium RBG_16_58_8]|nr:MAG: transcriptional regulator NrdR [Chloroflexi bacterium RBG_16_58_8]